MTTLPSILSRGYFPRELPPAFVTDQFANVVTAANATLPPELDTNSTYVSNSQPHNVARLGLTRRKLSIPNPVSYLRLCRDISVNWQALSAHCANSPISASTPMVNQGNGREMITQLSFDDLLDERSRIRSTSKYILKADLAKFYPSVYTHSIPWAYHGKAQAKANRRSNQLLGNVIDRSLRQCQDSQTIGIPIGPDTSLIIAEILMTPIDIELANRLPDLNCFRYSDDYEFGVKSISEGEEILGTLQEILQLYEINLNFDKSNIVELPQPLDPSWVTELRCFEFRSSQYSQRLDIIQFISKTIDLAKCFPNEFVLKYAVARLRGVSVDPVNWYLVEDFLLQCLMIEPGTFLPVLERLMVAHNQNFQLDLGAISNVLNHQIRIHAPAGRSSEVAWALWGLVFWSLPLGNDSADAVHTMEDSVVALLTLYASSQNLVPSGLNTTFWESFMTTVDLQDKQWLLSYEASVKGWLPSVGGVDHIAPDPAFDYLRSNGVEFFDPSRLITHTPVPSSGAGIYTAMYSPIVDVSG